MTIQTYSLVAKARNAHEDFVETVWQFRHLRTLTAINDTIFKDSLQENIK